MCNLPICESVLRGIFIVLHAHILGILSIVYALINLYKYQRLKKITLPDEMAGLVVDKPIYLVRVLNWTVFGISWFLFTFVPHQEGTALLRISVSFITLSEVLYNWDSLIGIAKGLKEWTRSLLR